MTAADVYREYLGGTTFAAAASSATVNIQARGQLWITIAVPSFNVADIPALQFNSDTGNNYLSRYVSYAAASTTATDVPVNTTNMARLKGNTATTAQAFFITLTNPVAVAKTGNVVPISGSGLVGTTAALLFGGFVWVNTTSQITSVTLLSVSGNNFGAGTSIRITGGDYL